MGSAMSFRAVLSVEEEAEIMTGPGACQRKVRIELVKSRVMIGHFGRSHPP